MMTANQLYFIKRAEAMRAIKPLREQALREIDSPQSIFADDRPTGIGRIVAADTFLWQRSGRVSLLRRLGMMVTVLAIVGTVAVPIALAGSASRRSMWMVIGVCMVIAFFSVLRLLRQPRFTDFFVGERGCSVVNFTAERTNVTSAFTFRYSDYNVFLLAQELHGALVNTKDRKVESTEEYGHTLFTTSFFNMRHFRADDDHMESAGFDQGTHCDQYLNGDVPEPQYYFWSTVEQRWTLLQMERLGADWDEMPRQTFYTFTLNPEVKKVAGVKVMDETTNMSENTIQRTFRARRQLYLTTEGLQPVGGELLAWADVSSVLTTLDIGAYRLQLKSASGKTVTLNVSHTGNRRLLFSLIEHFTGLKISTPGAE